MKRVVLWCPRCGGLRRMVQLPGRVQCSRCREVVVTVDNGREAFDALLTRIGGAR